MSRKRSVLEQLKRDELLEAVDAYDLDVADRRVRDQLIDALVRCRAFHLDEWLAELYRDRLKELCRQLDLDDSGRAKAVLVERLAPRSVRAPKRPQDRPPTDKAPSITAHEPVERDEPEPVPPVSGPSDPDTVPADTVSTISGGRPGLKEDIAAAEDIATDELDAILALQVTVAWAGEGQCEPSRLGWWRTDLIDPEGGGYLFQELFPETHLWASLEAVRRAAARRDAEARARRAQPDKVRTLFFWGFRFDEKIEERLATLKQQGRPPAEALSLPFEPDSDFRRDALEEKLRGGGTGLKTRVVPGGREIVGEMPDSLAEQARRLAAALLPLADEYPAPFFQLRD